MIKEIIMLNFKILIVFIIFFISSCTETVKTNGLSIKTISTIQIQIGKTTKDELNKKYGPPVFESIFNNNVIYYVSHKSSYLNFNPRKTKQLVVLEITLDDKNIVDNFKKYSEKDSKNINVSDEESSTVVNNDRFWKQILNNMKNQK